MKINLIVLLGNKPEAARDFHFFRHKSSQTIFNPITKGLTANQEEFQWNFHSKLLVIDTASEWEDNQNVNKVKRHPRVGRTLRGAGVSAGDSAQHFSSNC